MSALCFVVVLAVAHSGGWGLGGGQEASQEACSRQGLKVAAQSVPFLVWVFSLWRFTGLRSLNFCAFSLI